MKLLARFKDVIAGSSLAFSALARANAPLSCSNEEEKQIMAFMSIGSWDSTNSKDCELSKYSYFIKP